MVQGRGCGTLGEDPPGRLNPGLPGSLEKEPQSRLQRQTVKPDHCMGPMTFDQLSLPPSLLLWGSAESLFLKPLGRDRRAGFISWFQSGCAKWSVCTVCYT